MSNIDDGGQAFPLSKDEFTGRQERPGMSLRDWFAGQASDPPFEWMSNVMNTKDPYTCGGLEIAQNTAIWKYMQADAMLAARATATPAGEVGA